MVGKWTVDVKDKEKKGFADALGEWVILIRDQTQYKSGEVVKKNGVEGKR